MPFSCRFLFVLGPVEVCERETFNPRCAENQVLVVKTAQYGRMSLGRCVTKDYGYVGCAVDVTRTLQVLCSGRGRCEVDGSHPALLDAKSTSCAKDFASYLSVTYSCVPGKTFFLYFFPSLKSLLIIILDMSGP